MSKKINFWSVFAIVTGSQIGITIFVSPASLAKYGLYGLMGWLLSGIGAVALCLVFAALCARFPKTGGPHAYVNYAFGRSAAFFTGWTYWVVSWVSTTILVVASVGALSPFLGEISKTLDLTLQILLLLIITFLNLRGVSAAGKAEFILTLLKFIPLTIIPIVALFYFDPKNIAVANEVGQLPLSSILSQVILLTFFGFVGLESATTPAEDVENPSKTIPKAIVSGTICVALLYLLNSAAIFGVMPSQELANSKAPYADAGKIIFGGNWYLLIALISSIIGVGCLNAWIITSSQITLGLAQDNLIPQKFAKKNKNGAPAFSIFISCLGVIPLLILTTNDNMAKQINSIIDFSVTAFLFVYLACLAALIKFQIKEKKTSLTSWLYIFIATIFCLWVIYETPAKSLLIASLFTCSGIPFYFLWYKNLRAN